jgi:hypothetical protein
LETFIKRCDFDEIIFALARTLGDLAGYFGLDALKILNDLLENEETIIRQEALQSYLKMVSTISKDDLSRVIVPEVIQLKSQRSFAAKSSSLDLMAYIYSQCNIKDQ